MQVLSPTTSTMIEEQITMMLTEFPIWLIGVMILVSIWSLIWKGIALWKASKNNQLNWFIILLIVNTAGILEIIYINFFQTKPTKKTNKKTGRKTKK